MTIEVGKSSGGGGLPINSLIPINTPDLLHTANDDTVWLRTGNIETDIGQYPEASVSTTPLGLRVGGDLPLTTTDTSLTSSDDFIYSLDTARTVTQYNKNYSKTGLSFSATQATSQQAIAASNSHIYVKSSTHLIYQYDLDGTYTGFSFPVSAESTTIYCITMVGNDIWCFGRDEREIYVYDSATGILKDTITVNTTLLVHTFSHSGTHLYLTGDGINILEFDVTGEPTGKTFVGKVAGQAVQDIAYSGGFHMVRGSSGVWNRFTGEFQYVGLLDYIPSETEQSSIYVRVK